MNVELQDVTWPTLGVPPRPPSISADEYSRRCDDAYRRSSCDWLVLYGDREHWGNLCFLTGFDPRFEEALLILGHGGSRSLLVGNEGLIYAAVTALDVEVVLCQTLSLMGQPRAKAPRLVDVLRGLGITAGQTAGLIGWKYLEPEEADDPQRPSFVPAFLVDSVERVTGNRPVDATPVLMHPVEGLRATVSADQLAVWEHAASQAATAVFGVIESTRPGVTEHQAVGGMRYGGHPLSAHVMYASGAGALNGLRSPTDKVVEEGDAVTTAIGYWGGLTCRAGLVAEHDEQFATKVAYPYFAAIASWYGSLSLDTTGGQVWDAVINALAEVDFGPLVNPGHLIGHEEWTHSPFRENSGDALLSGMAMQCDIIPFPLPSGQAINAEDTVALADSALRHDLATRYPGVWARTQERRQYMQENLGIILAEEVLPLSPTCGYLPPFWRAPALACVIDGSS